MTDLFIAGADNPQHLALLVSCTVDKVAVNVGSLIRRSGFNSWTLDLPYPDWEWIAYTDGPVGAEDLALVLDKANKPPLFVVGSDQWSEHERYLPLYNGAGELPVDSPNGLFITDSVFQSETSRRSVLALRRPGMSLGVITGSSDKSIGRFDYVISSAWWSVMQYGETQVWDGRKLHRHNSKSKTDVRQRYAPEIEALNIDPAAVLADDVDEAARLAIESWQAYGESLGTGVVRATNAIGLARSEPGTQDSALALTTPEERHQVVLPGLSSDSTFVTHVDVDGNKTTEEVGLIRSSAASIRSCNNCHLATAGCPGYVPNSLCAYELPVQIRTREQLQAAMEAIIEIQTQRVLRAQFAEEIEGQGANPVTGQEIDRLFKSMEKMKSILDDRESFRMTVEAKAKSGVMSRIFGEKVGAAARQLPNPIDSNEVVDAIEVD